ncbi:LacI family transcriptional regulator [Kitasatospora herbaricolor]|uniref:LacI family DNA-binding transcriptional regulator n=1 Tax=Kitasatospora herbaricolor TaxID=68217 RepID=UPI00174E3138|nr:LacI family DNA-binding transcriptional regulator [Kitasatospora herbaricolor]MDQ0305868.1 DNA-binding LacI/PurR family transcriptional regulator [Kitasatospora herbaricolor]GGV38321.1 LacI family transcriptional regulator [Kitasatospora herbaricolor]
MTDPAGTNAGGKPARAVGIKEVARAAGLSITTVSHALNGKGQVSAHAQELVRDAAERLGYRPNRVAQALLSGRTGILGLVAGHRSSEPWERTYRPYYAAFTAGAMLEAVDRDYALTVVPAGPRGDLWTRVPMDGLIVVDPVADDPVVAEALRRGLAVVTDGRPLEPHVALPYVESDIAGGIEQVMDHLHAGGARSIGLLTGPEFDSYTLSSDAAHADWGERHSVPTPAERVRPGERALDTARRLLTGRPDAVYALNETYGQAVLEAAAEQGLAIPRDLMVAAMGEAEPGARPPLTMLSLDPRQTGSACAGMLIDVLGGASPDALTLPSRLVPGGSTRRSDPTPMRGRA